MDKTKFDQHIEDYIRANAQGGEIVTGWVIAVSVNHPGIANSDGYIIDNSEGLPYHSQLGLLTAAVDEKKNIILSQIIKE